MQIGNERRFDAGVRVRKGSTPPLVERGVFAGKAACGGCDGEEGKMGMKKRVLTLLVAVALAVGMCLPAYADTTTTYTLTLNNAQAGHTYTAYQIFAGDLHEDTLSNVVWGSGVTEEGQTKLGDAAKKAEAIKTVVDAEAFAKEVSAYLDKSAGSVKIGESETADSISGLEAGYYLVKTTGVTDENGVYTYYIMKVVKDTSADIKADVPTVDKVIVEGSSTVEATDVNIGDDVTFQLTAKMPSSFAGYKTYKVVFHDTLSAGLSFVEDSVKVEVGDKDVTSQFKVSASEDGKLTISCDDVLAEAVGATMGSDIVVTYKAKLNSYAKIGSEGNPNTVYLEYSNDPNWNGTPGASDEPTGKTPEDKAIVFTYELDVTKIAAGETGTKLQGAEFVLYRGEGENREYAQVIDGKLTGWTKTESGATTLVSDDNGFFKVAGLDDGTYWLEETKAPAGYNLLKEPIKVVIAATFGATQEGVSTVASLTISVNDGTAANGTVSTGVVAMNVENNKGVMLPETGGMGTTLFYIVGGILVVGAAALLIARRRSNSED